MRVLLPMGVTERYVRVLPDMYRDDIVTTQTTTQSQSGFQVPEPTQHFGVSLWQADTTLALSRIGIELSQ
jgi:hypothetical protein